LRTILFFRKYKRFHGGHLKVWNYFNHVLAAPGFDARVLFDAGSSWDATNPWREARGREVASPHEIEPDALFVAGRDWQRLDGLGLLDRDLPLLNLIQHIRHVDDWSIQSRYLSRRAIRLCVSDEVAAGIQAAGSHGPIVVIPNGIDVPLADPHDTAERPLDLFIAGLKQPAMATRAAASLAAPGRSIEVFGELAPRDAFLAAMRRARVTLFLPNEDEGFYLPALEGMALGTIVVCPDCVGNRAFCLPGANAFRPPYAFDALIAATEEALALPRTQASALKTAAFETAGRHSPVAERAAFLRVLADLDTIWAGA
jgi:glycosyltransferase involved in cell wall biosynthesis